MPNYTKIPKEFREAYKKKFELIADNEEIKRRAEETLFCSLRMGDIVIIKDDECSKSMKIITIKSESGSHSNFFEVYLEVNIIENN